MIALGIDPGTALLGFGVVEAGDDPRMVDYGAIATAAGGSMPNRLNELFEGVTSLLERYRPDVLAVEQLFFARNVTTAIAVGQARGVVLLAAARNGVPVVEYSPSEVKHAVVGYGKADKSQMQEMVRIILGLDHVPHPDDAADALAVALCYCQRSSFEERTAVESS
ncbi:MAG TPA: crossover junction endodeoxyribonuclease RuvC [Thermomicrobiales bacterium]|nr:crossover junction endodeoxyribonuclease RuvC [Thermomicrobiales bacterium]